MFNICLNLGTLQGAGLSKPQTESPEEVLPIHLGEGSYPCLFTGYFIQQTTRHGRALFKVCNQETFSH